ncbi:T9SS sorting signal type C domain-containing protein [Psychroserpens sp. XS_ASV72]|uniref:T9SS sorting signal type C domain-containing protein n=1 Tax=Psychroserpens sp. XS_ASV72 TaxID=3241293 RepID=UPI00351244B4
MTKKLLALLTFVFLINIYSFGQCTNTIAWGGAVAPTDNNPVNISFCNYQEEYAPITSVVAGETYEITSDCGGYITVRSGAYNGPVVGSGNEPYSFTATVSGDHYVHFNTNAACGTATTCCVTEITCTSCSGPMPPANDDPCSAQTLTVNATCSFTTYTNANATASTGVPAPGCASYSGGDVWFTATVPASGNITIDTDSGVMTDSGMAIYSGTCGSLSLIECDDDDSTNGAMSSITRTGLTPGSTIYIRVWEYGNNNNGTFDICVTEPAPPPSNDEPCNADPLTTGTSCTSVSGTIENATDSGIDACFGTPDNDVWYSFVATTTSHNIQITNIAGSDFDLYHAVYGGFTAPDCSVAVGDNVSCSDPNTSTVSGLTIGDTYFIQVFTYFSGPETTTFDICVVEPPPPPPNDEPCNAVALTPDMACVSTSGYVENATDSGIDSCFGTPDNDVWYSFVATDTTHSIQLSNVAGSDTDMYHAVYGGFTAPDCSVAVGDNISCSDANASTVTGLTIGDTYFVQVFTYYSAPETTTFDICIKEPCMLPAPIATQACPFVDVTPDSSTIGSCGSGSASETLTADFLDLGDTSDYDVDLIPYDATYFASLSAAATSNVALSDDDRWSDLSYVMPIDFCFFGNNINDFVVGANSMVSFNFTYANTACGYSFDEDLPSTDQALFPNTIYAAYHDIDPGVGGSIRFGTSSVGGCNVLVVIWDNVPMFYDNSRYHTSMLVLYEDTNIIEVYIEEKVIDGGAPWNGGNAIVGVQNPGATQAVVAQCRNSLDDNWTATNEAWRFTPSGGASIATLEWLENGVHNPSYDGQTSINVSPASTTTYTAEVTYALCDSSTLVVSDATTVTVSGGKVWTGLTSSNWMEPSNWSDLAVPTSADCVIIPATANDPILYDNANGDGLYMVIETGATLTLNADANTDGFASSLTIQDFIDIQGTGQLIIQDGASLIQVYDSSTANTPTAPNTGNITLYRDTSIRNTDYVYWSSPVQGFNVSSVYGGFTPTNYIYEWIPTVPTGTFAPGVLPTGGMPICFGTWNPSSGIMTEGKGYIVRGPTNHTTTISTATATFNGVANNGVYTQPISSGDNSFAYSNYTYNPYGNDVLTVTPFDDNWNLLGNPYPSALDAQSFLTHPNNTIIEGAVHIWTHGTQIGANGDSFYDDFEFTYDVSDYTTYNFSGTNTYTDESFGGKIASGQGFFVLALNDNESGSVTFNNSMRDRTHSNTAFYRTSESSEESNELERHRIWLNLLDDDGGSSSILVGYIENATQGKDRLYDAYVREMNSLSFYSKIEDQRMIIQGRTLPFDNQDQVPLGTVLPSAGQYTIAIDNVDGLFLNDEQSIYLEDTYTNTIHNLRTSPYSFSVSEAVDYDTRFILRYTDDTLSITELELNALSIKAPKGNYIKVNSGRGQISSVIVYDLLGRTLFDKSNINTTDFVIQNHNLSDGAYIVKATLTNGVSKVQKVVLKH